MCMEYYIPFGDFEIPIVDMEGIENGMMTDGSLRDGLSVIRFVIRWVRSSKIRSLAVIF